MEEQKTMITLNKIDGRMIHGQVVLMWTKLRVGERLVVVVDDTVAKDPFLKKSLESAGNAVGKPTYVWGLEEALEKVPKIQASDKKYFLICRYFSLLFELYNHGVDLGDEGKSIDFGTAAIGRDLENWYKMWNNIYVSKEDIGKLEQLHQKGINITFRLIPAESGTTYVKERDNLLKFAGLK